MLACGKVAVLLGGSSAEREVSLRSGTAVLQALQAEGIDAHGFDPAERELYALRDEGFDRAFIVLHGRGGEDGSIQGALDYLGIPYTGSGVLACALAMDKVKTKQIWQACGLPIAASRVVRRGDDFDAAELLRSLTGKVMVKPAQEGSSIGMASASTAAQLSAAIALAHQYDEEALVEAWLVGPEYTVAIVGEQVLPSIRLQTSHEFYDYAAKYQATDTQYHCPAGLSPQAEHAIQALAYQAFCALGAKGWGRIDVMCDSAGEFRLLEANLVPGMTAKSLVPMAARAGGMDFAQLVQAILALSDG